MRSSERSYSNFVLSSAGDRDLEPLASVSNMIITPAFYFNGTNPDNLRSLIEKISFVILFKVDQPYVKF